MMRESFVLKFFKVFIALIFWSFGLVLTFKYLLFLFFLYRTNQIGFSPIASAFTQDFSSGASLIRRLLIDPLIIILFLYLGWWVLARKRNSQGG